MNILKFFTPLNSRLKKLRKTCTIYVNHHGGKITSVFKTVHLFDQGQGQRAPDDEWWCASFNLRRLFSGLVLLSTSLPTCLPVCQPGQIFFFRDKNFFLPCQEQ